MYRNRSDNPWIATVLLVVGFALLAGLIAATFQFGATVERENDAVHDVVEVKNRLYRLLSLIQDAETGQRGYLLTRDEEYLRPYKEATSALEQDLNILKDKFAADKQQTQNLAELRSLTEQKLSELQRSISDRRTDNHERVLALVRAGVGKALMDRARNTIDRMRMEEDRLLAERQTRVAEAKTQFLVGTTMAGLLLAILAAFAVLSSRNQTRNLATSRDDLQKANARLVESHEQTVAAERFAAVGRLSADVAHEIRNPIAAMRLKAENALASGRPDRAMNALGSVLGQIQRVDILLRDLLNVTQARTLVRAPADIRALLAESAHHHEDLARQRMVSVVVQPGGLPASDHPHIDREQVLRALDNLLLNALQHAPAGSQITVAADRFVRDGRVRLHLSVSDAGPGIDDIIRPNLFEPFATARPDGTGLGLAIVRKIAQAHRGDVGLVDSETATTFLMDLPWQPS